jgi:hypothetical protein
MHKDGLSPNDLTVLMTQLWCKDFKEYRGEPPDRSRVQLSAAMLLYCFTSARAGEVHESTARRALARGQKTHDKELEARVLAATYKVSGLKVLCVLRMLILEIAFHPYDPDRQCGRQSLDCTYISAGICQGLLEKETMEASCTRFLRYLQGGYAIVSELSCFFSPNGIGRWCVP